MIDKIEGCGAFYTTYEDGEYCLRYSDQADPLDTILTDYKKEYGSIEGWLKDVRRASNDRTNRIELELDALNTEKRFLRFIINGITKLVGE